VKKKKPSAEMRDSFCEEREEKSDRGTGTTTQWERSQNRREGRGKEEIQIGEGGSSQTNLPGKKIRKEKRRKRLRKKHPASHRHRGRIDPEGSRKTYMDTNRMREEETKK